MKVLNFIRVSCITTLVILAYLVFVPVSTATYENTYDVYDSIINISESTTNDIIINLKNRNIKPYINRGIECGLNIENLKSKLNGQRVHLKFIEHWTPLDINNCNPSLAFIKLAETGEVIFNSITPS